MSNSAPAFLSVSEFAAETRTARSTAYAGVADGSIPSVKIGGAVRIPRVWLDRVVAAAIEKATERAV